jgi:hypothetical protein
VKIENIVEIIQKAECNTLQNHVFPKLYKNSLPEFENSEVNMVRSVALYDSKMVMGKTSIAPPIKLRHIALRRKKRNKKRERKIILVKYQ